MNFIVFSKIACARVLEIQYHSKILTSCFVQAARKSGFRTLYGDGSRPAVLQSAGISSPKAVMIMYTGKTRTIEAVQRIRLAFPSVVIDLYNHIYCLLLV